MTALVHSHAFQVLPFVVSAWLFCCGVYGIVTSKHLVHAVLCLAVLQSSTYVLLLAIGFRMGGAAPVYTDGVDPTVRLVDPIVQALMLTDVVVEAVVVALLLAIVVKAFEKTGSVDPEDLRALRG